MSIVVVSKQKRVETVKVKRYEFELAVADMDVLNTALLKEHPEAWSLGPMQVVEHPDSYLLMQQWMYEETVTE